MGSLDQMGRSQLFYAIADGKEEIAIKMVKDCKNINQKDKEGNTYLHIAAINGQEKVVLLLLEKGANVNALNNKDSTPLDYAVGFCKKNKNFNIDVIKILLEAGANPDYKSEESKFSPRDLVKIINNQELLKLFDLSK